jgi:hypothetical protein
MCKGRSYNYVSVALLVANGKFLIMCIALFSRVWFVSHSLPNALRHLNTFSPILDEIEFSSRETTLNGILLNDPWSIYHA